MGPKSRAQIQKEYRERKKARDPEFLARERQRQNRYRVPADALSPNQLKKRRQESCLHSSKYRQKMQQQNTSEEKQPVSDNSLVQFEEVSSSIQPEASTSSPSSTRSTTPLLVKFNFNQTISTRKRSKGYRQSQRTLRALTAQNKRLTRRLKTLQKRNERLRRRGHAEHMDTPQSKTKAELGAIEVPTAVKQKLVFANAVISQISETHRQQNQYKSRKTRSYIVASGVLRKYGLVSMLSRNTGIRRPTLLRTNERLKRAEAIRSHIRNEVISFFERDDVSRCMPGKKDATKVETGQPKIQTRILNDYLSNLYARFRSERPNICVSMSHFCKLRPKYVKLTQFLSRNICLCTIHQNFALKLQCLRSMSVNISPHPEEVHKTVTMEKMASYLTQISANDVEYEKWQKIDVNGMKKTRIVKAKICRNDFISLMKTEYKLFLEHVDRVCQQYKAIQDLKRGLPARHAIVQMDFSENFTCQSADEIQSAYWNSTSVTLHPVVVYYTDTESGQLMHKSFVFVSDLREHNAKSVVAILKKLIQRLKTILPDLETIHYWTDSPSSQYRNRYIFSTVYHHQSLFGVKARWNYFECGHGKSVCDGIGGEAKRQASAAVKQGKTIIQDADDFFAWSSLNQKEIEYIFYEQADYDEAASTLEGIECKPIPGTMTTHAVMVLPARSQFLTRSVSCYCSNCLIGTNLCGGWHPRYLQLKKLTAVSDTDVNKPTSATGHTAEKVVVPVVDSFVAAMYLGKWYVAKVIDVDNDDEDVKLNFMHETASLCVHGKRFKWPQPPDRDIWVPFKDLLTSINPPTPIGRSSRCFEIGSEELRQIEALAQNQA